MIDLNFHPLRKALQLSLNEMAVLKEVYELSNNTKFNGWCVKSRTKIADSLDLSRQCVITCLNTLQLKGYVEYNKELGMCKPTDMIRELAQERENIGIMIKTEGYEIMSIKLTEMVNSMLPKIVKKDDDIDKKTECQNNLQVSKKSTEVSKKLTPSVKKIDTYSISYSKSKDNIYIQAKEKEDGDRYISFLDYWDSYSVLVPEEKRNKKSETHIEWNKLNQEEKAKVLEYVNLVKFGKTNKKYLPSPLNVLVYKKYLSPPHEHKVFGAAAGVVGSFVNGVDEDGITEQEYKIHYSRISKEEAIRLILEGKGREIKNYTTYAFTCKKFELEQEITDDMLYHHGPRPQ